MTLRVLYVDDDRINSLLFAETCRLAGDVELECAFTGAEAQALLQGWRPDLLVLDLHLPDARGDALLATLRQTLGQAVPAILCTADEPAQVAATAQAAGFDGCWTKPVELPLVMAELARRRAAPASTAPR
jgi:CheY-like chemotaxis protein